MDVDLSQDGVSQDELLVLRETSAAVTWLTLNQPARGNLLSDAMLAELRAAIEAAGADATVRAIVLAAAGRIFCAGHDLREIRADENAARHEALFARCSTLMLQIERLDKPVIACVQGAAVAGGCQLVAACDLAYAAEGARFGVSGIDLGLFCSTPSVPLCRTVARKHATEMLMTGRLIEADEAARIGLINAAVPRDALRETVAAVAARIAGKSAGAVRIGKRLLARQHGLDSSGAYALAGRAMAENLALPDTREKIDAFLDRDRGRVRGTDDHALEA